VIVPDNFVFQRSIIDENGRSTCEDFSAQEILDSITYVEQRAVAYPSYAEQFDLLYHGGYDVWKAAIDAIKEQYPKS